MKKVLLTGLATMMLISSISGVAFAEDSIDAFSIDTQLTNNSKANYIVNDRIPDKMEPYSKLKYTSNQEWEVLEGNFVDDSFSEISINPEISYLLNPTPEIGMVVEYDFEGFIKNITVNDEEVDQELLPASNVIMSRSASSENSDSKLVWGISENTQIITYDNVEEGGLSRSLTRASYTLSGRLTVFTDTWGNHDNRLKKGDCALKMSLYRGVPSNTPVYVTAGNGKSATFYKNDVGSMPNAIVDIWKTGVEMLGYSYSSSWSSSGSKASFSY